MPSLCLYFSLNVLMLASLTCMRVPCCWFVVQKYAFPADELMPLSCQGRVRGVTKSRGDIDDALGRFVSTTMGLTNFVSVLIALVFTRVSWCCCHSRFSLTLVDSLDTLAVRSMQIALSLSVCGVCVCVCFVCRVCLSVCARAFFQEPHASFNCRCWETYQSSSERLI